MSAKVRMALGFPTFIPISSEATRLKGRTQQLPRGETWCSSSAIIQNVLTSTRNGSIIFLHDGGGDRSQTVAALPTIITALEQRGFQFVTIPRLIQDLPPGGTGPILIAPDQLSEETSYKQYREDLTG